ncbi:glycosyl hydrolase family 18 protein [Polaribacter sp. IC073]|uniref:glycosyl hydrolase family 18 protein n=1 Tax=Polaribacter sp. IC073 TaxID=2508540 RepID=UPI0011BD45EA|nr:glycosyl hydrolase family 18 protein [Polaribacter sp. IC073]TXD47895.1 T9SS type A sorting domain-containing protein [Polaribacter sp. IC073]
MKQKLHSAILYLVVLFSCNIVLSQEIVKKGIHELQAEEFGKSVKRSIISGKINAEIIPLQNKSSKTLSKMVFGFLPYWEQSDGAHNNIQYDLLTHLACFDFRVQLDAAISTPPGWPWITEINAAHAAGTKVIMTVVNFGGSDGADAVAWELFTNSAKQNTFFANVKNLIQTYSLDGVNIDFEGITSAHRGAELNTFMASLTTYIHQELPGKEVSFDGPAVNWGGWIMDDLVDSVDYLIIMAYDYTSGSSDKSGPVAPLKHHTSWKRSVKRTVETGTYKVPTVNHPEKLVLAIPYYGQHWKTATNASESTTSSHVKSTRYRNTSTEAATHGGWIWNADFEVPWYTWNDGSDWNQIWADNEASLSKKYDLAISNNLGGVGIWALNYDGTRPELWSLISAKFGATANVGASLKEKISFYPNPANNTINISNLENIALAEVDVYNILGKLIKGVAVKKQSVDISNLSNGVYFFKVLDASGNQETFKIIKTSL